PRETQSLSNLGNKLKSRYKHTEKIENLKEAILIARQAVDVTPKDYPDLVAMLNNLEINLKSQYKCIGKIGDLKEAL
ncbi:uncharacterized protein K441DRAFT_577491, partial [Cenococcum geophilum 1.58]|uniref:uncharacterized protein n=1 Tax=Cenococcum geophilum 1.58 TaxID=794803 RepID=UPI00358E5137